MKAVQVKCSNCGGMFSSEEAKCPFCDMIYEPGAEKEYFEKMEGIRDNLDKVDDIVVSDLKNDLISGLKGLVVGAVIVLVVFSLGLLSYRSDEKAERESELDKFYSFMDTLYSLNQLMSGWDVLYENGQYEELCESISENRFIHDIGFWKHYDFYSTYSSYMKAMEHINSTLNNSVNSYDFSGALANTGHVYVDLNLQRYLDLTVDDRAVLNTRYDELVKSFKETYQVSDDEYDTFIKRLTHDGRNPYFGVTDCEVIAEERLGK